MTQSLTTWVEPLGWTLVHSLWQLTLMALVAWILDRALGRHSPAARYGGGLVMLAAMVTAPVVTWIILLTVSANVPHTAERLFDSSTVVPPSVDVISTASATDDQVARRRVEGTINEAASVEIDTTTQSPWSLANVLGASAWRSRLADQVRPWLPWIVAAWLLGAVVCSARPWLGWLAMRRLERVGVSAVPESIQTLVHSTARRLGVTRSIRVLQSSLASVPLVLGYLRPVILFPASALSGLTPPQIEAIVGHELAHIRRHDLLANLLQTLVETLFFYHPAVWWLSNNIRCQREHCCDDVAARLVGNRWEYGRALLALEEQRSDAPVLAMAANRGSLTERIRRLVETRGPVPACGGGTIGGIVLVMAAALVASAWAVNPPAKPQPVTGDVAPVVTEPTVAQRLARITSVDVTAKPLIFVLSELEQQHGVPVTISLAQWKEQKVDPHMPITLKLANVSVQEAFVKVAAKGRLTVKVLDKGLEIVALPAAEKPEPIVARPGPVGPSRVVDAAGKPIARATVEIQKSYKYAWIETPPPLALMQTDDDGRYVYPESLEQQETFVIYASAPGFMTRAWYGNSQAYRRDNNGQVQPDTLVLQRPVTVSGRILDEKGQPMADAEIAVDHFFDDGPAVINGNRVKSDAQGRFTAVNVPPAQVFVRYSAPYANANELWPVGVQRNKLVVVHLEPKDGQTIEDVVVDLRKANCVIEGTIVDEDGKGVAGRRILAMPSTVKGRLDETIHVTSDDQGRFRFEGLTAEQFHIGTFVPGSGATVATSPDKPGQAKLTAFIGGQPSPENAAVKPVWGEPNAGGFVASLRLEPARKEYQVGDVVTVQAVVRNPTDKRLLYFHNATTDSQLQRIDAEGNVVQAFDYSRFTGIPVELKYVLEPGQEAVVTTFSVALAKQSDQRPRSLGFVIEGNPGKVSYLRCNLASNLFGRPEPRPPFATGRFELRFAAEP